MSSKMRHLVSRSALTLTLAVALIGLSSAAAQAAQFEIPAFAAEGINSDQSASTQAGGRPSGLINSFSFPTTTMPVESTSVEFPLENAKDISVELPPGIVGNAASYPRCSQEDMDSDLIACPPETQIGVVEADLQFSGGRKILTAPVYNMAPPTGEPAQFGFRIEIARPRVDFHIRSGSDYGVAATLHNVNESAPLFGQKITIWGVPGDPGHDALRADATGQIVPGPYPGGPPFAPFLSNPTSCSGPLVTTLTVSTWQHPGEAVSAAPAEAPRMTGCANLGFAPTVDAKPSTTDGDSPAGLDFHLHIPQSQDPDATAVADLRESKVVLPPSLTVDPSSANGRGACDIGQIGYTGPSDERQFLRYDLPFAESFRVSQNGSTTPPIPADADRAEVTAAIETLPGLAGNVSLQGAPGGWIVSFDGALAGAEEPALSGAAADLEYQTIGVTGEGGGFNLQSGGASTGAEFEATFAAEATGFISTANATRPLRVGEVVEGEGFAPGTKITGVIFGTFINISQPTTEAKTGAQLETVLPAASTAEEVQKALAGLPSIGEGNIVVRSTGVSGSTRSSRVIFVGALAGTSPVITSTSSLTGPGAGAVVVAVAPGPEPLHVSTMTRAGIPQFTPEAANCPPASEIGTVEVSSPAVIDHPLKGSVYLATPHQNPFDSLLAIYIAVNDPQSGVVLKLPGLVEADPQNGQLTATFSETPQLPFEDLSLSFFKGDAAPLKTSIACGTYEVKSNMVPWSAPEGETKHPRSSFAIDQGCSASEAQAPNTPSFEAGTVDPSAGKYSPFVLKLSRADGTQQLTGIDTTLPKGLLARLAGTPYCSDQALAAAAGKSGKEEQASPTCPSASKVGSVTVGAGAGGRPFYAPGSAYLAGPYKGAPLSLAVITPAVAGPFDLGTVVVRNALYVDPTTAQVHAVSDPFPRILQGIPLDIRSIALNLDKPSFTSNPTNCSPFAITGAALALSGQSANLNQPFQAAGCDQLGFKPKLKLSLKGKTKRTGNPAVKAVLSAPPGQANVAATTVILPSSQFIDNRHINGPCTRVQFAANACPPSSILGTARAYTPLLDKPLEGPVYFRSNGGERELPDLVADLDGQIQVTLVGFIDSVHVKGTEKSRVRTRFASVPDAPVSRFELSLYGGKKGLIQNSKNLCKGFGPATVQMTGQNGRIADSETKIATSCGGTKKHKDSKQHHRR